MPETSVRISEDHKELIEEVADQLDTSIKAVVGFILDWFFSSKGGGGQLDVDAVDAVDEEDEE